jgi:hypothetical protein
MKPAFLWTMSCHIYREKTRNIHKYFKEVKTICCLHWKVPSSYPTPRIISLPIGVGGTHPGTGFLETVNEDDLLPFHLRSILFSGRNTCMVAVPSSWILQQAVSPAFSTNPSSTRTTAFHSFLKPPQTASRTSPATSLLTWTGRHFSFQIMTPF